MTGVSGQHMEFIMQVLRQAVPEYAVWAFGSRVHGRGVKPFSDLDLAVITPDPLPSARLAALKSVFSESDLPFRVDVVDWAEADPAFQDIIRRQYEVLKTCEK